VLHDLSNILVFILLLLFGKEYKLWSDSIMQFATSSFCFTPLRLEVRIISSSPDFSLNNLASLPNWLTLWSGALLQRSIVVRTLDSFPSFYGTPRFNTEFTRSLHLSLSWVRPIQSPSPHSTSTRSVLMLSTYLRLALPSGLFPSDFPTNNLYTFLFSAFVLHAPPITSSSTSLF
jgi:hypothetical protein